jgi:hypothetical protein
MPPESQENPYASPKSPQASEPTPNESAEAPAASFAHQAVRFALYAPVLMIVVEQVVRASLGAKHPGVKMLDGALFLMIALGFVVGVAGIVGSFRRFSLWSILLGLFGVLVNWTLLYGFVIRWLR